MKTFDIGYFTIEENAKKFRRLLEGKTYMNFHVDLGISPSGYHVTLSTDYDTAEDATDEEILTMALYVLSNP